MPNKISERIASRVVCREFDRIASNKASRIKIGFAISVYSLDAPGVREKNYDLLSAG